MRGERNGAAKLTEDQVRFMRWLTYYRGMFAVLAQQFRVSHTTIRKAYQGETWGHVS